jgi:ADP-ribosylglycohydrolase
MSLPGGGPHKVAPGQITDDGELTLSLLHGLINGNAKLNLKEIVK